METGDWRESTNCLPCQSQLLSSFHLIIFFLSKYKIIKNYFSMSIDFFFSFSYIPKPLNVIKSIQMILPYMSHNI